MTVSWSRPRVAPGDRARLADPVVLPPLAVEDDVVTAARTWLRLSWLAALPGLNPLWWLGAAHSAVAVGRARSRPFSAEGGVRVGRRLLLAGQAVPAAVAVAAAVVLVMTTGALAALIDAGPLAAGIALVHAGLMAAGVGALVGVLLVAVPPTLRRRDAVAARMLVVLIGVTWAAPVAAAALVSALS
jgi:hypothetical protein